MQILMRKTKKLRANGMPKTSATCAKTPKNKKISQLPSLQ